ncbi:uncharacterized protein MONBRDRAFT_12809 [Monosiga brevicollis MX1]|uniref:DNA-PKcs N-terminal domain-containing protein n=1 Tax=Monosiga brevicollis TaxID=81824 RepID=A9VDD9_MONBE|nr:uncharacterized protein MONBRDRAFT_12809 [Monosiga brevicollis MX1]EDQ84432.1 predicted protein [Monosiga brevicollis MX1]|eukprot:XP_001750727.1 hypothetical protein [Monosiga brevicollis MX1]
MAEATATAVATASGTLQQLLLLAKGGSTRETLAYELVNDCHGHLQACTDARHLDLLATQLLSEQDGLLGFFATLRNRQKLPQAAGSEYGKAKAHALACLGLLVARLSTETLTRYLQPLMRHAQALLQIKSEKSAVKTAAATLMIQILTTDSLITPDNSDALFDELQIVNLMSMLQGIFQSNVSATPSTVKERVLHLMGVLIRHFPSLAGVTGADGRALLISVLHANMTGKLDWPIIGGCFRGLAVTSVQMRQIYEHVANMTKAKTEQALKRFEPIRAALDLFAADAAHLQPFFTASQNTFEALLVNLDRLAKNSNHDLSVAAQGALEALFQWTAHFLAQDPARDSEAVTEIKGVMYQHLVNVFSNMLAAEVTPPFSLSPVLIPVVFFLPQALLCVNDWPSPWILVAANADFAPLSLPLFETFARLH